MFIDDSTKARLLKLVPSLRTDDVLYYLLAPHLLGFWTFLKPKHAGNEIGDVLFVFGDVCIIFEAKTRDKIGPTNNNWIRSKLTEAVGQIAENHRKLSNGEVPTIRNAWLGEVDWASLGIKHFQGIVVMMHDSDPYDPRDIASSLFESLRIPLHVISLHDMSELMRFMNTPWDFIVYWEFRHAIGKTHMLPVHQEQRIYWTIVENWIELARSQGSSDSDEKLIEDQRFIEEYTHTVLRSGSVREEIKHKVAASYLIDIAAGSIMQKAEMDVTGKRVGSKNHLELVKTVQVIAELSRRRRVEYGYLWLECAQKSTENNENSWANRYSPSRNRSYLLNARPALAINENFLLVKAKERMALDDTSLIIGLSATANNIIQTYDDLLSTIEGKNDDKKEVAILNTTSVLVDRTE